ncbi:MAG: transcriptional repressor [Deltaproteobacteria bacterium]|jgi:Fur family ferric uptake transcriptional regulator|nr:transcriptional repressor [Deltaproteobacteria bacterium]
MSVTKPSQEKPGCGDLSKELGAFRTYLKSNGYRVTREREAIAEAILRNHEHFDVDELFMELRSRKPISKASIYRAIPLMIKSGVLTEVYMEDGHMHYEKAYGREHHSHLRCLNCRRIFEFSAPELAQVEKRIARQEGFKSLGHKFEIWGLCSNCQGQIAPAKGGGS